MTSMGCEPATIRIAAYRHGDIGDRHATHYATGDDNVYNAIYYFN